jgi:hypothetical protein
MKWSSIHNFMGWLLGIAAFIGIIKFHALTTEWVFSLLCFVIAMHYWLEARVDKIEERFMLD